jgi:hypothetical protein
MVDLRITEMPLDEVLSKPSGGGRQPSPRDLALDQLVVKASLPDNAEKVFAWNYSPDKKMTATAAAKRSIKRTGMDGKVFVSSKGDQLYFSQTPLRKPRNTK